MTSTIERFETLLAGDAENLIGDRLAETLTGPTVHFATRQAGKYVDAGVTVQHGTTEYHCSLRRDGIWRLGATSNYGVWSGAVTAPDGSVKDASGVHLSEPVSKLLSKILEPSCTPLGAQASLHLYRMVLAAGPDLDTPGY